LNNMHWFQILFNYPLSLFREGHLVFTGRITPQVLVLVLLALAVGCWWTPRVRWGLPM